MKGIIHDGATFRGLGDRLTYFGAIVNRERIADAIRSSGTPIKYGLRLWLSVCVALYIAFWLQLDEPYWAGTSAGIACLPQLGAGLRKGWFRVMGTLVGATVSLTLAAFFPQDRILFLLGLAIWGAACAFTTSLLTNYAAYGAGLAGYSVAIIAGGSLGATGGVNADVVFHLAVARTSEICIGIFCAGVIGVLADVGDAPRRVAISLAVVSAKVMTGFADTLARAGTVLPDLRPVRRDIIKQTIALDPVIDQAVGESSQIRSYSALLQRATDGLFGALVGWRSVGNHLESLPPQDAQRQACILLGLIPPTSAGGSDAVHWIGNSDQLQQEYAAAAQRLVDLKADTPSIRLLADKTAEVLAGVVHALIGLTLVVHPGRPGPLRTNKRFRVPDVLPAFVNAGRAFLTIGAIELLWVTTGWPNGVGAIAFTMVNVILRGPQAGQAYASTLAFMAGAVADLAVTAIIIFAVLPGLPTDFLSLAFVIGVCLVPLGVVTTRARTSWQIGMVNAMTLLFVPFLSPTNPMNYDGAAFWNQAIAIVVGCFAGAYSFSVIPSLSPNYRSRRLLRLTLRDLRRLLAGKPHHDWIGNLMGRLTAMPPESTPLQRARLLAALSVGSEFMQLSEIAGWLGLQGDLAPALAATSLGDTMGAIGCLSRFDQRLRAIAESSGTTQTILRAQGGVLLLSEALTQHSDYFDDGA
jgi:hypothetical protein